MPEFLTLHPPEDALDLLLSHLPGDSVTQRVKTEDGLGRVTSGPVLAPHDLPEFPRSTVDGFAVRASDTFGASEGLPAYLNFVGEVPMGSIPGFRIEATQCALIHTGGMLPEGADAVVMVEYTQWTQTNEIEILKATAVGENIIQVGEDVITGQEVIPAGTKLRPAEIGGLMALGLTEIEVIQHPKVGIISSGDEVIPPGQRPLPGQVRDVNAYTLKALIETAGGKPVVYGIIPDTQAAMLAAASSAKEACDVVVITAGSSASTRDLTAIVIDQLGKPGVLVHGVNVRPGKPTILAVCDGTVLIGLPGNPVSALVIAELFVVPVIKKILGEKRRPRAIIPAVLTVNLSSQAGREDWVPVHLVGSKDGYKADPIFGRSNLIFTLARADGLVRIASDATGLPAGQRVEVLLMA